MGAVPVGQMRRRQCQKGKLRQCQGGQLKEFSSEAVEAVPIRAVEAVPVGQWGQCQWVQLKQSGDYSEGIYDVRYEVPQVTTWNHR